MTAQADGQEPAGNRPARGDAYLLGLRLDGRRVVVVGGGAVAARRVPRLLAAGADVMLVSPAVTPALEELAAQRRIDWRPREYQAGDCAGAWLVVACAGPSPVNAAVADEAERNRVWCVRADDAAASTVWTPAGGRVGDASVGVLTGDPRRSAAIRDAITTGLQSGTISARHYRRRAAGVALVGGGPGDPGLITVRGRRLLAEADVVIADRLGPRELLAELSPDVTVIDAGKVPYRRQMSQDEINAGADQARAGREVRGQAQGRRPVRLRPGRRGDAGLPAGRGAGDGGARDQQRDRGADLGRPAGDAPGHRSGLPRDLGPRAPGRRALDGGLARPGQGGRDAGASDGTR